MFNRSVLAKRLNRFGRNKESEKLAATQLDFYRSEYYYRQKLFY